MLKQQKKPQSKALMAAKQRAVANARKYGVARAINPEMKKQLSMKVNKTGSKLTFSVRSVWTKSGDGDKGSETGKAQAQAPTLKNSKVICRLVMPSDSEIEANSEMKKFMDKKGGIGVEFTGYLSDTMKTRAKEWNRIRAKLKKAHRESLKNSELSAEEIESSATDKYGEDIHFDGPAQSFFVNRDNWIQLPEEVGYEGAAGCRGSTRVLKAQAMDSFTLTACKFSWWVKALPAMEKPKDWPEGKDWEAPAQAYSDWYVKGLTQKGYNSKRALPSGRASAFLKSTGASLACQREETVLAAMRRMDEVKQGSDNPHLSNFLPTLEDMVDVMNSDPDGSDAKYFGPVIQRFTSSPDFERFAQSSGMVTRVSLDSTRLYAGDEKEEHTQYPMAKLFISPTQWKESEAQQEAIDLAHAAAIEKAAEEGITDEEERNAFVREAVELAKVECAFDPEKSVGWQYAINLTLYSRLAADLNKQNKLASMPIGSIAAFKMFAPTLLGGGLDFFASHKIAVETSNMHPSNGDASQRWLATEKADRFKAPMYVLESYPERVFFNWAEIVQNKCVPLSAAGAKALFESSVKRPECASLQRDQNVVKALNELPETQIATYFTGEKRVPVDSCTEPRYSFFALVPIQFDERNLGVFKKLQESYLEGYEGPLGEVLLDETYTVEDAEAVNAHEAIVAEKLNRIPLIGDQLASLYVLVVDNKELAKLTSVEVVRTCLKEMFCISPAEKKPAVAEEAASAAEQKHAHEGVVEAGNGTVEEEGVVSGKRKRDAVDGEDGDEDDDASPSSSSSNEDQMDEE